MPLTLVRATANRTLWDACADRFLTEAGGQPGPTGHALQADVYRAASAVGRPARVRLHFTGPGSCVDMEPRVE